MQWQLLSGDNEFATVVVYLVNSGVMSVFMPTFLAQSGMISGKNHQLMKLNL